MLPGILTTLAACLLGSVPFGYLLVRWREGADIRAVGSGNIGATNVFRQKSRALGVLTLALDAGKGALAVWLALRFAPGSPWPETAAVTACYAHAFPVFLKFKGGKGVATGAGAFAVLHPMGTLASVGVFALLAAVTRYVSVGSIAAAAALPASAWLLPVRHSYTLLAALAVGALVAVRHRDNIRRLMEGTEIRTFGKGKSS
jgi:glycerol-3-phosphate acyltransferase PlsY